MACVVRRKDGVSTGERLEVVDEMEAVKKDEIVLDSEVYVGGFAVIFVVQCQEVIAEIMECTIMQLKK